MNTQEQYLNLITLLKEEVGTLYTEENNSEFQDHIAELLSGDLTIASKRASALFSYWSNINFVFGDEVIADSSNIAHAYLAKEYKFAIANELAILCPYFISKELGKQVRIESQEQFELFKEILKIVDDYIRKNRLPDGGAIPFLLNVLYKDLFKLGE
jgi:hypothetical protein